jgi:ABC-type bacteriocin/lantibiotic exporter with double-glycine peptidase domain
MYLFVLLQKVNIIIIIIIIIMEHTTYTHIILYRYLLLLGNKISRCTTEKLLNTPVGNSLRGMSDALDTLHVKNAAYQLPQDYLLQLDAPFIAVTKDADNPFCIVYKINNDIVYVSKSQGKQQQTEASQFLKLCTGEVLISETGDIEFPMSHINK